MTRKTAAITVLLVLLALAGAAFGTVEWVKAEARAAIESRFAALRAGGTEARYRDVAVSLMQRTVAVSGISLASRDGTFSLEIGRLAARLAGWPQSGRIDAQSIRIEDARVTLTGAAAAGGRIDYTMPAADIAQYSGPLTLLPADGKGGDFAGLRLALRQLQATTAGRITLPKVNARIAPAPDRAGGMSEDVGYDSVVIEGVDHGLVQRFAIARIAYTLAHAPVPAQGTPADAAGPTATGEVRALVASRIDTAPLLAMTEGGAAAGDRPLYGELTTGAATFAEGEERRAAVGSMRIENVAVDPSAVSFAQLARIEALGLRAPALEPDDARQLLGLSAQAVSGLSFSRLTLGDLETRDEAGFGRTARVTLESLARGVLQNVDMEDLAGGDLDGRLAKVGRFTARGLDLPRLLRLAGEADASARAAPELFGALAGFAFADIEVPDDGQDGAPAAPTRIAALSAAWSDLKEGVPTRLSLRLTDATGRIDPDDGEPFLTLSRAGLTDATVSLALDLKYDEAGETLSISPASVEVKDAFRLRLEASASGLSKAAFTAEDGLAAALPQLSAGPVSLSITDLGLADLVMRQFAEADGTTADEFRARIVAFVEEKGREYEAGAPGAAAIATAVAAFLKNPKVLTVTATPKGRVPLLPLVNADDPTVLLETFSFTATAAP